MGISLTSDQRRAIRSVVLAELSVIGDIPLAIDHGEGDLARCYRRRCEGLMRLLDDLGWDEPTDGGAELTMPADQLVAILVELLLDQIAVAVDASAGGPALATCGAAYDHMKAISG